MVVLRIYTDDICGRKYPLTPLIRPLFKRNETNPTFPWHQANIYKNLWDKIEDHVTCTAIDDCDFAVIPVDWYWVRGYNWRSRKNHDLKECLVDFNAKVKESKKKTLLFFTGDRSCEDSGLENVITFRHSMYRSRPSHKNDFSLPVFVEDFVEYYLQNKLNIRPKKSKATIGFCGLATRPGAISKLKLAIFQTHSLFHNGRLDVSPYIGEHLRTIMLDACESSPEINTNFIVRDGNVFIGVGNASGKMKLRNEYVENMVSSDYILCARGSGNFSFRIYETLSLGRIPIIVDTDKILPFDDIVDWRKHAVFVKEQDIYRLPEIVAKFHESITDQEFREIQERNREFWLKWLSPEGFFSKFHLNFNY